jgi:uncharacterized protein YjeT (DUF2065 family)
MPGSRMRRRPSSPVRSVGYGADPDTASRMARAVSRDPDTALRLVLGGVAVAVTYIVGSLIGAHVG